MEAAGIQPPLRGLWVGLAGAGREAVRRRVEKALSDGRLSERVTVGSDAEAALFDAFAWGPGMVLICGTGSMVIARTESGEVVRAGGWGGQLGDEGGGYDLGLQGLRAVARAVDRRGPATSLQETLLAALGLEDPYDLISWAAGASKADVAALAPALIADGGRDGVAREIVGNGVRELHELVQAAVARGAPWSRSPGIALAGGLISPGAPLRSSVERTVRGLGLELRPGPVVAVRGAARLAGALFLK
jgi:N-acetylglucosamine kinase-like BadF-type ATPase